MVYVRNTSKWRPKYLKCALLKITPWEFFILLWRWIEENCLANFNFVKWNNLHIFATILQDKNNDKENTVKENCLYGGRSTDALVAFKSFGRLFYQNVLPIYFSNILKITFLILQICSIWWNLAIYSAFSKIPLYKIP